MRLNYLPFNLNKISVQWCSFLLQMKEDGDANLEGINGMEWIRERSDDDFYGAIESVKRIRINCKLAFD